MTDQPQTIGQIFASWMATADGCDCGNTQPPDACIPSTTPGMAYRCHYRCGDCGATWTRAYPPTKTVAAYRNLVESGHSKTAPAGNRGLTTVTVKES